MHKITNFLIMSFLLLGVFTTITAQNVEFQLGGKTNAEKFEITDSDGNVLFQLKGNGKIGLGSTVLKSSKMHVQGSINAQGVYKLLGKTVLSAKGPDNILVGEDAGKSITSGFNNTFTGYRAGYANTTGYYNTFIGNYAGGQNVTGSMNVFLGYYAGYNETGSNKLYIDNSTTTTPLIWGDFSADSVRIHGDLNVTGALDVSSTSGALIVPRMTTTQRDNLPTIDGSIVYNTTTNEFNFRENGAWVTK
jgi:hypothetical protein